MPQSLTDDALAEALAQRPAWSHDRLRHAIHRRLHFSTFGEALAAMVRIGIEADKLDHHPEWTNVYNRLDIWLTTHDAGGVTTRDLRLADIVDTFYQ